MSFTSDDLPLPETPVTQINLPKGKATSMFFKLCSLAPLTVKYLVFGIGYLVFKPTFWPLLNTLYLLLNTSPETVFLPDRYCPVNVLDLRSAPGVPWKITRPPCFLNRAVAITYELTGAGRARAIQLTVRLKYIALRIILIQFGWPGVSVVLLPPLR